MILFQCYNLIHPYSDFEPLKRLCLSIEEFHNGNESGEDEEVDQNDQVEEVSSPTLPSTQVTKLAKQKHNKEIPEKQNEKENQKPRFQELARSSAIGKQQEKHVTGKQIAANKDSRNDSESSESESKSRKHKMKQKKIQLDVGEQDIENLFPKEYEGRSDGPSLKKKQRRYSEPVQPTFPAETSKSKPGAKPRNVEAPPKPCQMYLF